MQFSDSGYDDIYGAEENTPDEFERAGASKFIPACKFSRGHKNPKVINGKVTTEQARGFFFAEDQIPEDLKLVLQALVEQGDVAYYPVRHSSKEGSTKANVVGHFEILQPRFYVLALALPNREDIFDDVRKQKGIAAGYQTFLGFNDQGDPTYNRTTFLSALVVEHHLFHAGYADGITGAPKPVRLSVDGYNADQLYEALEAHADFIEAQRAWVA